MKFFSLKDLVLTIILLIVVQFFTTIILSVTFGIPKDVTVNFITYLVSAILSCVYFKKTGRTWWYGLFTPIIVGLIFTILIILAAFIFMSLSGGPTIM